MLTLVCEQFVANPKESVEQICKFLDLELSKPLLEKLELTSINDQNCANRSYEDGFEQKVMSFF